MLAEEETFTVDLQPIGRRIRARTGETLLEAAQSSGIELQAVCGGAGTCGHCRFQLVTGRLSDVSAVEVGHLDAKSLRSGWRLACQASVTSDATVAIPAESLTSEQRVQLESQETRVEVDGTAAASSDEPPTGLAVDLGTTKLAGYLVNLKTGETIAQHGLMNPQIAYGEDVISRISYASRSEECRQRLADVVRAGINKLTQFLCEKADIPHNRIKRAAIAGNTAMHHLFAGLPVDQLGKAPYLPASIQPIHASAKRFALELNDEVMAYTPPNIAGYLGGDHIAMLLGIDIEKCEPPTLAIDIGTNTELTLKVEGCLLTCSCASGPAFEGAHIRQGMRAAPGAIECVRLHEGAIQFYTIDRRPPCGICGSGIVDAIAALLDAGVLDVRGNFSKHDERVRTRNGTTEFVLADSRVAANGCEVTITRQDVCEVQLAKAAIRAGIEALLATGGIQPVALKKLLIAGAFGSYLDPISAIRIGLLPAIPSDRIQQVGNAAGLGIRKMVASATKRQDAENLASTVEYIELTNHPAFREQFTKRMLF